MRDTVFIAALRRWDRRIRRHRRGVACGWSSRPSTVRIHVGAVAGAELGCGPHHGLPLGSMCPPSPARICVLVFIVGSLSFGGSQPPPSGSIPGPSPARIWVLVLIVSSSGQLVESAAAVRIEARSVAGADLGAGVHRRFLSSAGGFSRRRGGRCRRRRRPGLRSGSSSRALVEGLCAAPAAGTGAAAAN
jgi:hypothetical protein